MRQIQQEMGRQARTDPLTGLLQPARLYGRNSAPHTTGCDREDKPGTLLFADLTTSSRLNDRLGHEVGDLVFAADRNHAAQRGAAQRSRRPTGWRRNSPFG